MGKSKTEHKEPKVKVKDPICKIVALSDYVGQVPSDVGNGDPRRRATLLAMFEANEPDKLVTHIVLKGETYFVFKV